MAVYTLRARARAISLPRVLFTGFPRGQTLGTPHTPDLQLTILRQALGLLEKATAPEFYDRFDDKPAG